MAAEYQNIYEEHKAQSLAHWTQNRKKLNQ